MTTVLWNMKEKNLVRNTGTGVVLRVKEFLKNTTTNKQIATLNRTNTILDLFYFVLLSHVPEFPFSLFMDAQRRPPSINFGWVENDKQSQALQYSPTQALKFRYKEYRYGMCRISCKIY